MSLASEIAHTERNLLIYRQRFFTYLRQMGDRLGRRMPQTNLKNDLVYSRNSWETYLSLRKQHSGLLKEKANREVERKARASAKRAEKRTAARNV